MKMVLAVLGVTILVLAVNVLTTRAELRAIKNDLARVVKATEPRPWECLKGSMVFDTPSGFGFVGEQVLCGDNLHVSPIFGPDLETYMDRLRLEPVAPKN